MVVVDLLCLANSTKSGGRCVAGLRLNGDGWVRPVGQTDHGELVAAQYTCAGGVKAAVLDEIRVPLTAAKPQPHQPENWEIEPRPWELLHRPARAASLSMMRRHTYDKPLLLGNDRDSVPYATLQQHAAPESLALVKPEALKLCHRRGGQFPAKARATFAYQGHDYDLVVTDPPWKAKILGLPPGDHDSRTLLSGPGESYLTISLGEPFGGACYKLVAAVFRV